jgi:protein ImuA
MDLRTEISTRAGFADMVAAMARQPLHEIGPALPGDEAAALGCALGLAVNWAGPAGVIWVAEEGALAEMGGAYPPGLAAYGLDLSRLILVRAGKREEALWATEQGLAAPGAVVICSLAPGGRALDLKATRRLLLFAERAQARCLLLRPLDETSSAWTRWRVASAPSQAEAREVGAPAFALELVRSRTGPAGARFTVEWNGDGQCFTERVAGASAATSADGSADPRRVYG